MLREFIETEVFKNLIDQLDDHNLKRDIEDEILKNPSRGDVIQGSGGIRKLRVGKKRAGRGKSGGFRVLYLDLPEYQTTYLIFIYEKGDLENITSVQKQRMKEISERIKNEYKKN